MLLFLDYYNLEGYNYRFNFAINDFDYWFNKYFNQSFVFELTWKGRLFFLLFLWLIFIESVIDWKNILEKKPKNRYVMFLSLICALIPTAYVIAINFFGLDLTILKIGREAFGIRTGPTNEPSDFLFLHWPLSCEYIISTIFFVTATIIAYGKKGLKFLSISFSLLGGIGVAYLFDTIYPFGLFKPLQEVALITAAATAALFDLLGYTVLLRFPPVASIPDTGLLVYLKVNSATVNIGWACAGVHSLLLYVLIILVFFKKSTIPAFRKLVYFIIGFVGTFFTNVLRIYSIIVIMISTHDQAAGMAFHDTYGEFYFLTWVSLYIIVIVCVQRFMLVEKTRQGIKRIHSFLGDVKNKFLSRSKVVDIKGSS